MCRRLDRSTLQQPQRSTNSKEVFPFIEPAGTTVGSLEDTAAYIASSALLTCVWLTLCAAAPLFHVLAGLRRAWGKVENFTPILNFTSIVPAGWPS